MKDETNSPVANTDDSVNSPEQSQDKIKDSEPATDDKSDDEGADGQVSYATHRKLLDEKKKLQAQIDAKIAAEQKAKEDALREQGKYKELLDEREKELEEYRTKLEAENQRKQTAKKLSHVIKSLGSENLEDKWYGVIHGYLDDIPLTESGEPDPAKVNEVSETLKKQWPEMLSRGRSQFPNGKPPGGTNTITRSEWEKLPAADMKKYRPDQIV